jgi:hypothetical protein
VALDVQSRFSDSDRLLQRQYLVSMPHKVLSAEAGIARQTVTLLANAAWPVQAFRAFQFAAIQHDFRFLQILAERAGARLFPQPGGLEQHWSLVKLFSLLVVTFGEFLMLAEKIEEAEVYTDEQLIQLEKSGEQIKALIDAHIAKARQLRAKQRDGATQNKE